MKTDEKIAIKQKKVPFLWFDDQAEEAAKYYVSIFKNSTIKYVTRYPKEAEEVSGKKEGTVMTVEFILDGVIFTAINGGPDFKFSPATSFVVNCETQQEVDYFWEKLGDGGVTNVCGWLDDKFGVTWQIVPVLLDRYLSDKDPVKTGKAMEAMLKMTKIDINLIKEAFEK